MVVENNVPLQALNTFHIVARAQQMVRIASLADAQAVLQDAHLAAQPKFVLGGGSNLVLTGDVKPLVLKVEVMGCALVQETPKAYIVEAGAGENWHDFVAWTLAQGLPGLENMALIPGTVGAAPVQNIGAYGVELQDVFDSLDALDLRSGEVFTLDAARCAFGYRDSVFKHDSGMGLKDRALILKVRFALPKVWKPVLGYADIEKMRQQEGVQTPNAQQIFDWVCRIRRAKLPDPAVVGNARYDVTRRDAFGVVNLRAGIEGKNWQVSVFANNLLDKMWLNEVIPAIEFGGSFISPGQRRIIGGEVSFKF